MRARKDAQNPGDEVLLEEKPLTGTSATLVLTVSAGGECRFNIGPSFKARPGRWVGAKVGVFAAARPASAPAGAAIVRGVRFTR